MKIIVAPLTGSAMLHSIEGFDFADGKLQVRVSATPLESNKVLSTSAFTSMITAPLSLLGPDPMPDIEAWLVGSDGPYASGVLVDNEDVEITAKRMIMLRDVRLTRDRLQAAGTQTPYGRVDTNMESQIKLVGAVVMALASQAAGVDYEDVWTMFDGTDVEVDAAKITQIGVAAGQHVSACQRRKKALEAEINEASTLVDLEALDIASGWPDA